MIQFNLLPDVKVQFIKTKRLKRVIVLVAVAATVVSVLLLILTFGYAQSKKAHIANQDKDIQELSDKFNSNTELTKILSVQNQLNSLPALYNGRPAVGRTPEYLDQVVPEGVRMGRFIIDFSLGTIEISGTASGENNVNALALVNSFVDTLKFTNYVAVDSEGNKSEPTKAFDNVVLSSFGRDDKEANYSLKLSFDPVIFDVTKDVTLTVPQLVTTRSSTSSSDIFDGGNSEGIVQPVEEGEENGNE